MKEIFFATDKHGQQRAKAKLASRRGTETAKKDRTHQSFAAFPLLRVLCVSSEQSERA
jgi:hypothetical protein